ncbi:hypothetical protein [Aureimonas sp. Leaf454]|uniref:hypothetical protein n=1 Tax=Aureimonas sp. Leaf454 TaxID=1736381 RepID=UPI0012E3B734|nr:hypothetical protein [Aureimonas sp. Leaf454]
MSSNGPTEPDFRITLREAAHLQAMEGNPLDGEQIAMFEMFDREERSDEDRLQHIRDRALKRIAVAAAE